MVMTRDVWDRSPRKCGTAPRSGTLPRLSVADGMRDVDVMVVTPEIEDDGEGTKEQRDRGTKVKCPVSSAPPVFHFVPRSQMLYSPVHGSRRAHSRGSTELGRRRCHGHTDPACAAGGVSIAHISYLLRRYVKPLLRRDALGGSLITYRTGKSRSKTGKGLFEIAGRLRGGNFDLGESLLPNSFKTALLCKMAMIPRVVGYDRDGRGFLLTDKLLP